MYNNLYSERFPNKINYLLYFFNTKKKIESFKSKKYTRIPSN